MAIDAENLDAIVVKEENLYIFIGVMLMWIIFSLKIAVGLLAIFLIGKYIWNKKKEAKNE